VGFTVGPWREHSSWAHAKNLRLLTFDTPQLMNTSFRTELIPSPAPWKISANHRLVFYGSCFSEHMHGHFKNCGFQAELSPQGILFDPFSIARNLLRCLSKQPYSRDEVLSSPKGWVHPDFHGNFRNEDPDMLVNQLEQARISGKTTLENADFLFLSPGTAYFFTLISNNRPVANCHKISGNSFVRSAAEPQQITTALKEAILACRTLNPNLKVVLTLSPVKHLRDGLTENFLSKSILRVALHELEKQVSNCYYFPSYELLTEDLRDYRFYSADMAHPSQTAIQYITDKCVSTLVCSSAKERMEDALKISRLSQHKPSPEGNAAHERQLQEMQAAFNVKYGKTPE